MRILVADDDLTSRTMLAAVLTKNGHQVQLVTGGYEALAILLGTNAPRLAILDWMMPDMDGIEVVNRVRARQVLRPSYLIMLTSRSEKRDIIAGLESGASDYLAKPFDPGELQARVEVGRRMILLEDHLSDSVQELSKALEQVKTLRGIVPICASCKKIRDDAGYWQQVEVYVREHTEAQFSHGICPDCLVRLYPEHMLKKEKT